MDDPQKLKRAVTEALRLQKGLDDANVLVTIDGSTVLLEGTVDDASSASLAERVARAVPGVQAVQNRLELRPDLAAEAEPKQTEFGDKESARAATGRSL